MNLEKQADFVATVTGTDVKKDQTTIHCLADMESYGRVRFSVTLEIAGDRSGGALYGSGRVSSNTLPSIVLPAGPAF